MERENTGLTFAPQRGLEQFQCVNETMSLSSASSSGEDSESEADMSVDAEDEDIFGSGSSNERITNLSHESTFYHDPFVFYEVPEYPACCRREAVSDNYLKFWATPLRVPIGALYRWGMDRQDYEEKVTLRARVKATADSLKSTERTVIGLSYPYLIQDSKDKSRWLYLPDEEVIPSLTSAFAQNRHIKKIVLNQIPHPAVPNVGSAWEVLWKSWRYNASVEEFSVIKAVHPSDPQECARVHSAFWCDDNKHYQDFFEEPRYNFSVWSGHKFISRYDFNSDWITSRTTAFCGRLNGYLNDNLPFISDSHKDRCKSLEESVRQTVFSNRSRWEDGGKVENYNEAHDLRDLIYKQLQLFLDQEDPYPRDGDLELESTVPSKFHYIPQYDSEARQYCGKLYLQWDHARDKLRYWYFPEGSIGLKLSPGEIRWSAFDASFYQKPVEGSLEELNFLKKPILEIVANRGHFRPRKAFEKPLKRKDFGAYFHLLANEFSYNKAKFFVDLILLRQAEVTGEQKKALQIFFDDINEEEEKHFLELLCNKDKCKDSFYFSLLTSDNELGKKFFLLFPSNHSTFNDQLLYDIFSLICNRNLQLTEKNLHIKEYIQAAGSKEKVATFWKDFKEKELAKAESTFRLTILSYLAIKPAQAVGDQRWAQVPAVLSALSGVAALIALIPAAPVAGTAAAAAVTAATASVVATEAGKVIPHVTQAQNALKVMYYLSPSVLKKISDQALLRLGYGGSKVLGENFEKAIPSEVSNMIFESEYLREFFTGLEKQISQVGNDISQTDNGRTVIHSILIALLLNGYFSTTAHSSYKAFAANASFLLLYGIQTIADIENPQAMEAIPDKKIPGRRMKATIINKNRVEEDIIWQWREGSCFNVKANNKQSFSITISKVSDELPICEAAAWEVDLLNHYLATKNNNEIIPGVTIDLKEPIICSPEVPEDQIQSIKPLKSQNIYATRKEREKIRDAQICGLQQAQVNLVQQGTQTQSELKSMQKRYEGPDLICIREEDANQGARKHQYEEAVIADQAVVIIVKKERTEKGEEEDRYYVGFKRKDNREYQESQVPLPKTASKDHIQKGIDQLKAYADNYTNPEKITKPELAALLDRHIREQGGDFNPGELKEQAISYEAKLRAQQKELNDVKDDLKELKISLGINDDACDQDQTTDQPAAGASASSSSQGSNTANLWGGNRALSSSRDSETLSETLTPSGVTP